MKKAQTLDNKKGDSPARILTLGIQHVFAMFGSTVLVPNLTGLSPAVTLFCMGIGTWIFHLITKRKVPAFMGSSFAFIAAICTVREMYPDDYVAYVGGGIIVSGILYVILSGLVKLFGTKRITDFFPPVVTGTMIIIIGMMLAPTAMSNIMTVGGVVPAGSIVQVQEVNGDYSKVNYNGTNGWISTSELSAVADSEKADTYIVNTSKGSVNLLESAESDSQTIPDAKPLWKNWAVAIFTVAIIIIIMFFGKGFIKLVPILIGIIAGYLAALALGMVDVAPVAQASWFELPEFTFPPKFSLDAILLIAPVAVVTFVEHIGDITANGAVTGHDYIEDPGLHRTLLGCGLASIFSGGMGGPAATTYSENTGVLAATKNYNPVTLRVAATFAILLSFLGKVSGLLTTIPSPVLGGVSIVLFGMIASVGLRMLVENKVNFTQSRNLIIAAVMLVLGLGVGSGIDIAGTTISGTAIAAVLGVVLNKVLPYEKSDDNSNDSDTTANKKEAVAA